MYRIHAPKRAPAGLYGLVLPVIAALTLAAAANGVAPAVDEAAIEIFDNRIQAPDSVTAGPTTFAVSNKGQAPKTVAIRQAGAKEAIAKLDAPVKPGESATLEVTLRPGRYEAYCPTEGMEREVSDSFTVTPARQPS